MYESVVLYGYETCSLTIKGTTQTESVSKQDAEDNTWTEEVMK
jgi:hypothetical protein